MARRPGAPGLDANRPKLGAKRAAAVALGPQTIETGIETGISVVRPAFRL